MKKFVSALIIGICVGLLASLVLFLKGLIIFDILAYFFFWIGLSFIISYTFVDMEGWVKGLLLAELLAIPVFFLSIGSYSGESLVYVIANIVLINGFLGMVTGYFIGVAEEGVDSGAIYAPNVLKKIVIALISGFVAGLFVLVPVTILKEPLSFKVFAVANWIALSIVISFINTRLKKWLSGLILVNLVTIPLVLLFVGHSPRHVVPTLIFSQILGAALGAFNGKYAKAVVPKSKVENK